MTEQRENIKKQWVCPSCGFKNQVRNYYCSSCSKASRKGIRKYVIYNICLLLVGCIGLGIIFVTYEFDPEIHGIIFLLIGLCAIPGACGGVNLIFLGIEAFVAISRKRPLVAAIRNIVLYGILFLIGLNWFFESKTFLIGGMPEDLQGGYIPIGTKGGVAEIPSGAFVLLGMLFIGLCGVLLMCLGIYGIARAVIRYFK